MTRFVILLCGAALIGCGKSDQLHPGPSLPEPLRASVADFNRFGLSVHQELLDRFPLRNKLIAPLAVARAAAIADLNAARDWTEISGAVLRDAAWLDWDRLDHGDAALRLGYSLWARDPDKRRRRDVELTFRARASAIAGDDAGDRAFINRWGKLETRTRMHMVIGTKPPLGPNVGVGVATWSAPLAGDWQSQDGLFHAPAGTRKVTYQTRREGVRVYRAGATRLYGVRYTPDRYELLIGPGLTSVSPGDWSALHEDEPTTGIRFPAFKFATRSTYAPQKHVDVRHAAWMQVKAVESRGDRAAPHKADRPFFFAVRDRETKLILMLGTLFDPGD